MCVIGLVCAYCMIVCVLYTVSVCFVCFVFRTCVPRVASLYLYVCSVYAFVLSLRFLCVFVCNSMCASVCLCAGVFVSL